MIILKKIVASFFLPVSLTLELLAAGLFLLCFTGRQRLGKGLVACGAVLLALLSHSGVANRLMGPLESAYPPLLEPDARGVPREIPWVVVLSGGNVYDPRFPVNGRLSESSLARLVEGIRIHRRLPGSKLLFTGGKGFDPVSEAESLAELAKILGVREGDIVLENESWDTEDQAVLVEKVVGKDAFVLVTSAIHMPRSMALFRAQGLHPIPAPVGHRAKNNPSTNPADYFPKASALVSSEQAFHEYLGLAWAALKGQARSTITEVDGSAPGLRPRKP